MSDSKKSVDELIDEVMSFIRHEREIYGDFTLNNPSEDEPISSDNDETSKTQNVVSEPPVKQKSASSFSESATANTSEEPINQEEKDDVYSQIQSCTTLEELEALCQKADELRTDLEGTQLVFGVGNPHADLMLIGEAPGAEEDKQGEPFVGKAGQLLNQILEAINFKREDVYIANILKHRPPNNRNPKPEERERSLPFLLRQIDLIEPKLILSLGKVSAQTLLNKNTSLSRMRGTFHTFRDKYELLATYHPAALLRHAKWKRPTWEDVQMLRERYDELGGQP